MLRTVLERVFFTSLSEYRGRKEPHVTLLCIICDMHYLTYLQVNYYSMQEDKGVSNNRKALFRFHHCQKSLMRKRNFLKISWHQKYFHEWLFILDIRYLWCINNRKRCRNEKYPECIIIEGNHYITCTNKMLIFQFSCVQLGIFFFPLLAARLKMDQSFCKKML